MKILFVTNSIPFPPRNGVELPIARIAEHLAQRHVVDFLSVVATDVEGKEFDQRRPNVPNSIRWVHRTTITRPSSARSMAAEMAGIRAAFEVHGRVDTSTIQQLLEETYDYIWVSPIGCLGLLKSIAGHGVALKGKLVVGLNDATYGIYLNGIRTLLKRPDPREWRRILRVLRTPWIMKHERALLRDTFALHVQTPLEQARVERLFKGLRRRPAIICAQNGVSRLEQPTSAVHRVKAVVFMTHLSTGRRHESKWFLKRVWPKILKEHPDAELWLVGSPPENEATARATLGNNVRILGYVENLEVVLARASVGVIPTLQFSGWVNRVADYLQADLPIVACPEPLSTIAPLTPGIHALSAADAQLFADEVSKILSDPASADEMIKRGRELANTFPTWAQSADRIEKNLIDLDELDGS